MSLYGKNINLYNKSLKPEVQKLLWRSRRGMLELDALFRGYLFEYGDDLTGEQLQEFEALLAYQDQDLFDAFSGKTPLTDSRHHALFEKIRSLA